MKSLDYSYRRPRGSWPPISIPPIVGAPVPMVPMPEAAASVLGSYRRFLVSGRARDRKIELDTEIQKSVALFMI